MSEFAIPTTDRAEYIERARDSCPVHGPDKAGYLQAGFEINDWRELGFDDEAIIDYAHDTAQPSIVKYLQAEAGLERAATVLDSPPNQGSIHRALRQGSVNFTDKLTTRLAEDIIAAIGERPTGFHIQHLMFQALSTVHLTTKHIDHAGGRVEPQVESRLVNQLVAKLIAQGDVSSMCGRLSNNNDLDRDIQQQVSQLQGIYRLTYPDSSTPQSIFIEGKVRNVLALSEQANLMSGIVRKMPVEATPEQTAELRKANDQLAALYRKIQRYDIKPIDFRIDDTLAGHDVVLHSTADFTAGHNGEEAVAYVRLLSSTMNQQDKLDIALQTHRDEGGVKQVALNSQGVIGIDANGELHSGFYVRTNTLPLRMLLESQGLAAQYEVLRARLLGCLFDAVAPATIVERFAEVKPSTATGQLDVPREASDIVGRIILPRLRYLAGNKNKEIHRQFTIASKQEEEHLARQLRLHGVSSHLRLLPPGGRASKTAIEHSKLDRGDDFIIPDGYTYVRGHQRGSAEYGRVLGHVATQTIEQ